MTETLQKILPHFQGKKILVLGDLMLDEHIWSKVRRISPEAPVPIAEVEKITHVPGGCGNVAANIKALGGEPILISTIGKDTSGQKLIQALKKLKIKTSYIIKTSSRPTILKSRVIAHPQQVVRVDREKKAPLDAATEKKILQQIKKNLPACQGIILSDYGKGILSDSVCQTIIRQAKTLNIPVSVDPKGMDYSKYQGATIITPNLMEAESASQIKTSEPSHLVAAGTKLLLKCRTKYFLITRGSEGMSLFSKSAKPIHIPALAKEVFDITGAGDTVISALTLALASKAPINDAVILSNFAASIAVGKIGTQPVYKEELKEVLENIAFPHQKIRSRFDLKKIVEHLRLSGKKIVFTNGCFDILHLGHIRYLKKAKSFGDILIIGLNSDSSVRILKGPHRPYVAEIERAEVLSALECVDYICIFKEKTPHEIIRLLKPDVHVKGGDYKIQDLPEAKVVKYYGGEIKIAPIVEGRSTSSLIDRIKKSKE